MGGTGAAGMGWEGEGLVEWVEAATEEEDSAARGSGAAGWGEAWVVAGLEAATGWEAGARVTEAAGSAGEEGTETAVGG